MDCPLLCQHEKYTSQLQMDIKSVEGKQQNLLEEKTKLDRSERKSLTGESGEELPKSGEKDWESDTNKIK